MSDYGNPYGRPGANPRIDRGDGVSGRGLLIAVVVLVALVVGVAMLGGGAPPDGAPAATETTPAAPTAGN